MPVPPKLKDRYEIREVLGKGGMGVVYKAYDIVVKREVALKTILDIADRKAAELFQKEYEVLASMSHPNIIEIFDLGEFEEANESIPYFVMPLMDGVTLDKLISSSSHRLTVERSVDIVTQICRGLQAAHERGLVHRDLKPSNMFVMNDDSVKIIDFGVVHRADVQSTKGIKGTLLYMAPEIIEMKQPSPGSDLFSLGVVAYEILTQRRPFERPSHHEIMQAILHYNPPPASDLNSAVNRSVSQVIHKAMAKQPYHRFSSAREFAETLQKALRNEPIEFFDLARIQPRIQRATKAFEQGDYQFADEILTELEGEGHIDPAISLVRRRLDQAIRQKRVMQLLESARTRFEQEEYPLALQKVQEVLELEPDNAAALALKRDTENKRTEAKIEDWFLLASQHISNHAYSHAREALQNVLQLKPKESRALRLLAEVDRLEHEYLRVRQEKEQIYQAALEAWQNGEISSALSKLERVLELDRRAPDSTAPERGTTYQNFYKQVRSEFDALNGAYAEARKHLADRNFAKALALCNEYLTKYPGGHALFQALKFDVEEQQRQELSAYIADIDGRVGSEPDVGKRVNILKEALDRYPGEAHFERSLRLMREKRDLVNSIVTKAQLLEERSQFNEALGQWEILRTIYSQYPGLSFETERVIRRRDQQARSEAKARSVEEIDRHLHLGDFPRALELLQKAQEEFPNDAELLELEKLARQRMERAAEAQGLVDQARELCVQRRFEEAIGILGKARELDEANPIIRTTLVDTLIEQARGVLDTDWHWAEVLIEQALDLDPAHALGKSVRTLALDRKREEIVDRCVSQSRQLRAAGDLESALKLIEQALESYPQDPRLSQLQLSLNKELDEFRQQETRRRDLEEVRRLDRQAETISFDPAALKPLSERAQEIARRYPDDREFQSLAASIRSRLVTAVARPPEKPTPRSDQPPLGPPAPAAAAPKSAPRAAPETSPEKETVLLRGAPPLSKAPPPPPPAKPTTPERALTKPATVAGGVKPAVQAPKIEPRPPAARVTIPKKPTRWGVIGLVGLAVVALIVAGAVLWKYLRSTTAVGSKVSVEVRTSPQGAQIRINDKIYGTSNRQVMLPPGSYRLEAQMEGYQPAATTLNVAPNAPLAIDLALQALAQSAHLYTDLDAGKVWLDEQPAGELQDGQYAIDTIPAGKHTLKVEGSNGEATVDFQVSSGGLAQVSSPVTAKDLRTVVVSSLGGRARVYSSPGSADLAVDGQPAGEAGPDGLELNNLAPGAHELTVGKQKDQRKMLIEIGQAPALAVFLSSDRNVGTLVVVTGEDNVHVVLDGKESRRTTRRGQLRLANLEVREHTVRVFKDGYQSASEQKAEIHKGEETRVEFKLVPVPSVASLTMQGALSGAEIFLDQSPLGTIQADGTFSASNISPGEHTLELRKEQYKPKRITKHFRAGETLQLTSNEVALEMAIGTLRLNLSPADSQVTLKRVGEAKGQVITETTLNLPEGSYILEAHAAHYASRSVTVRAVAGETKPVDLALSRETGQPMAQWENPSGWTREGNWFVHRGGDLVLYRVTPTAGQFVFTVRAWKGHPRLQWVINHTDDRNYVLFQLDKKFLYCNRVRNGQTTLVKKVPHNMEKKDFYTLRITIISDSIFLHETFDGKNWISRDAWTESGNNFTKGKFGFLIQGNDEVALSNFAFYPQ